MAESTSTSRNEFHCLLYKQNGRRWTASNDVGVSYTYNERQEVWLQITGRDTMLPNGTSIVGAKFGLWYSYNGNPELYIMHSDREVQSLSLDTHSFILQPSK